MPRVDAFGAMLLDRLAGQEVYEIVERDDGFIAPVEMDYFAPVRRWPAVERQALRYVRGRVLDVGVGAGRVALELQARGRDVVGIDVSEGALEVCRRRGVRDVRLCALADVDASFGSFDTVVMFGNNFGLFASPATARARLRRLPAERVVATSLDPHGTDDPAHLRYHERNRARGRAAGELRLRVRYRDLVGPWFDYLIVSRAEMTAIAASAGWRVRRFVGEGAYYVGVLERA